MLVLRKRLTIKDLSKSSRKLGILVGLSLCLSSRAVASEGGEEVQVPTGFARDLMMPIATPVLSSYHAIRENIFLNMRAKEASFMESIGNFLLAPSHYLFAGKKVVFKEDLVSESQVFNYKRLHWLKTTLSILALPVSEVLGATVKGLAYLSPEVRRRHRKIKRALNAAHTESHVEHYLKQGISALYSEEYIPCQGRKRPSRLNKKQEVEIRALKEIVSLFEQHGIVYWIDCGTCLGAYRYGGIIPWDWDIDLSIFVDDHDNVKKVLATLDPNKYQIQDWSSYSKPKTFLKLYVKETRNFIDIYHYEIDAEAGTVGYLFTYIDSPFPESWKRRELECVTPLSYSEVFPLKKAHFDGLTVRAPHNVVAFLQSKYGENLNPTMEWDEESQTYRKVVDHPYHQEKEPASLVSLKNQGLKQGKRKR